MTKRSTDDEESQAPLNRKWNAKELWLAISFCLSIIGWLIYMGVGNVLANIEKKLDVSRYESDQAFIKNDLSEIKSGQKEMLNLLRQHEQNAERRK